MVSAVVVGTAAPVVVVDASVVVVSGRVVVLVVVEAGTVEDDDDLGTGVVLELPAVPSGEAVEQDAMRTAASNAVRRAKDRIRTGMDRISDG